LTRQPHSSRKNLTRALTIKNAKGLHARAAAKFVQCAENFKASISVSRDGTSVEGTSIMGLLMLGASRGTIIDVEAHGIEAHDALEALSALVAARFHED